MDKGHTKSTESVLKASESIPENTPFVRGFDFNEEFNFQKFIDSYFTTGFQATNFSKAIDVVNQMINWKPSKKDFEIFKKEGGKGSPKCTVFLGFTSNMISSGVRESIRYLVEHKLVDVIVTTAGGIEEDLMKTISPHYLGDFRLDGKTLRDKGHNRIGNLLVPNENYIKFENWFVPLIEEMHQEQDEKGTLWTPAKIIDRCGAVINDKSSVCYWAHKNKIPIFCPGITDGSIGDMFFFNRFKRGGFVIDILEDLWKLNNIALQAYKTGMLILGGGLPKHHICNANLMRNGTDYSVYINTGVEYDGSDSGAAPDEAVSWGKISGSAEPIKVWGDATLLFPLLVAATFRLKVQKSE